MLGARQLSLGISLPRISTDPLPVEYRSSLQELSGLVCQQVGICVGPMVLAAAGRASWYHASLAFSHDVHQLTLWYEQHGLRVVASMVVLQALASVPQ